MTTQHDRPLIAAIPNGQVDFFQTASSIATRNIFHLNLRYCRRVNSDTALAFHGSN